MFLDGLSVQKRAIAYYRHSAEDKQENSVAIQREHTHKFAQENNLQIIHEEVDEGKSGLSANRPGFDQLFKNWILAAHQANSVGISGNLEEKRATLQKIGSDFQITGQKAACQLGEPWNFVAQKSSFTDWSG